MKLQIKQITLPNLIGLVLSLLMPLVLSFVFGGEWNIKRMLFIIIGQITLTIILLMIVFFWEREKWNSIGLKRMSAKDVIWGITGFFLGVLSFMISQPILKIMGLNTTLEGIERLMDIPILIRVILVLSAGITEEIFFRGYAIERLTKITGGNIKIGAFVGYTIFVLIHIIFWGIGGTIQIALWSIIITLIYIKQRNLWACIIMHILNDAYAFLVLPLFIDYIPK